MQPISDSKDSKLSLKKKIAQFLQKNSLFMNMSFVDRFVHNQLDVLPPAIQGEKEDPFYEESAEMILKAIIYYVMNVEGEEKTLSRCNEIAKQGYENEDGVNILKNILEKEIHSKSLYVFMDIATEKSQKLIMEKLKDRLSDI